jgi:hypothetical protein
MTMQWNTKYLIEVQGQHQLMRRKHDAKYIFQQKIPLNIKSGQLTVFYNTKFILLLSSKLQERSSEFQVRNRFAEMWIIKL